MNEFIANQTIASRDKIERKDPYRSPFQVDRDRIMYSKAFRRLRGKTQIFIAGYDDHIRNRLSHTLEVAQIARTVARATKLDEDLCEAIALGHDIGHTPFGHVGERALNAITKNEKLLEHKKSGIDDSFIGFKHNWQSIRVATFLERHKRGFNGLNLTHETIWGMLNHSGLAYSHEKGEIPVFYKRYLDYNDSKYWTIEAYIVKCADEIAQRHHDIEDGLVTGVLEKNELLAEILARFKKFKRSKYFQALVNIKREKHHDYYLELFSKMIVGFYVTNLIDSITLVLPDWALRYKIKNAADWEKAKSSIWSLEDVFNKINFTDDLKDVDHDLQEYLKTRILYSYQAQKTDGKAEYIIRKIIEAYLTNPQQMPDSGVFTLFCNLTSNTEMVLSNVDGKEKAIGKLRENLREKLRNPSSIPAFNSWLLRSIIDYISGMTDDFAIHQYELLYGGNKINRY